MQKEAYEDVQHIVCGKFDNVINFTPCVSNTKNKRVRIGSKNPNKLKFKKYIPIATNGQVILFENKIYKIREFLQIVIDKNIKNLIMLTIQERTLILEALVDFNIDLSVFEVKFPIFEHIKYISNIHKNHSELVKLLDIIVNNLAIKGNSIVNQLTTEYLYKIERKLKFKKLYDIYFAQAYKGGYQEVFKLKEERSERIVIAFDFNSMFVDCMMGKFLEPKSIKYKKFNNQYNCHNIANGLYKVILKKPKDTFFKTFHPFKYVRFNKAFYFNLEEKQYVKILLFKNEIKYYQKFFQNIEIIEGFYNHSEIEHPLKTYAQNLYKTRIDYKKINNTVMSNLTKLKLITIHSATNPKKFITKYFKTKKELILYIESNYSINFPEHLSDIKKIVIIQDYKFFDIKKYSKGYKVKLRNFGTNESLYSFSSQIIANSRMKMIQTIENFLKYNSVEICYVNVDSIHISLHKSEVENFLSTYSYMISNKLGDLKIESMSKNGYWFDIGRYWLISDKNIDNYKNIFFNHKGNKLVFNKTRKIKFVKFDNFYKSIKTKYSNIYNTFTYNKRLIDNNDFLRYNFSEIYNFDVATTSICDEILKSKQVKISLFESISTV